MALEIRDASLGYGTGAVLTGVNLKIEPEGRYLLHGANGSGKTTLIRSLLGLQPLLRGDRINGFRRIGYVPQSGTLDARYPLTVSDAVSFGSSASLFPFLRRKESRRHEEAVGASLRTVGMEGRGGKLLRECSGGELQRTLIARALLDSPDLLVMDEPVSSIDRRGKAEIWALVRTLHAERRLAFLVTTHESEGGIDDFFLTRILVEDGGILVETGDATTERGRGNA